MTAFCIPVLTSTSNELRRRRRLHSRDLNVSERGSVRRERERPTETLVAGSYYGGKTSKVHIDHGRRWPHLVPFTGEEREVGSMGELLASDELSDAELWKLIKMLDDELYGAEIDWFADTDPDTNPDLDDPPDRHAGGLDSQDAQLDGIEALMSEAPGVPSGVVWIENWDHRDPDPDQLVVGTTKPYAMGFLVA